MPSKRANGQGSVYRRGPYWVAQITIGYNDKGQPRYKRKGGFRTKTEALEALPLIKEMQTRKPVPTVSYYYSAFCKGRGAGLSQDKRIAYRIAYNRMAPIHNTPISELGVPQLQELVNSTCSTYYPARDMRVLLNHLFRLAAADGNANPVLPSLIEIPRLSETQRDAFTKEEQMALWRSYEAGNGPAAIPLMMIYTGMMTGEMRRLTADMVHLEQQEIIGVGIKTGERRSKSVLIPDAIVPIFEDALTRTREGLLFPMDANEFYRVYYQALTDAGVTRHLTPYSCRHTTATALAVNAGVAPQTVQRIMRWSSTRMMDRYVHPDDSDAREALEHL